MFQNQTVYRAGRVEGMLRLHVPPVNLGYDQVHAGGAGVDAGNVESTVGGEDGVRANHDCARHSHCHLTSPPPPHTHTQCRDAAICRLLLTQAFVLLRIAPVTGRHPCVATSNEAVVG